MQYDIYFPDRLSEYIYKDARLDDDRRLSSSFHHHLHLGLTAIRVLTLWELIFFGTSYYHKTMMGSMINIPSFWFAHSIVVFIFSTLVILFALRAIYYLFLSPLSVIPGPWYAAVSDFWLTTHVVRLHQCQTIQELFDTYGPVVRVGPNKVVFRDLHAAKNVYSVHKFDKSAYYKSLLTCVLLVSTRFPPELTHIICILAMIIIMRKFWLHICASLC